MKLLNLLLSGSLLIGLIACDDDDDMSPDAQVPEELSVPSEYVSENYNGNVSDETLVVEDLAKLTADLNAAEANAQGAQAVEAIAYPNGLSSVTLSSYGDLVTEWLVELVKAANDDDGFQNPGSDSIAVGEEGGLLGTRLLDEHALELEQMVEKGSFGAALYNHALDLIDGDRTNPALTDRLLAILGSDPSFDPASTTAAATYARRRSNQTTETGPFFDIQTALLTAKAAIEAGREYDDVRDKALEDYLLSWEESNFATVIYYCNATKVLLQQADGDAEALGGAMHAYAEGVGFAHGFKGLRNKKITDDQIDRVLELLLAPEGQSPESYRFLNDASLLSNLDQIIMELQDIYDFTDEEVASFLVNDPS